MSTTPPDRPTEPLRPRGAVAPVPPQGVDPNIILLRLEDAVTSLRTGLMVVGLIAVVALGIAVYALVSDDSASSGSGSRAGLASDARVSRLSDRVDRLSSQVQDLRSGGSTSDLKTRVDELEQTVKTLNAREDPTQSIKDLSDRVDQLSQDVQQLQQNQP